MGLEEGLREAARWLAGADAVVVCVGDSDLGSPEPAPPDVLAESWEPLRSRGLGAGHLCDPRRFKEDPQLFWQFWLHCCNSYRDAPPHRTRWSVQELASRAPAGAFLLTGSPRADWPGTGWPQERLLEWRGTLACAWCPEEACGGHAFPCPPGVDLANLPRCPRCGATARPALNVSGRDEGYASGLLHWQCSNLAHFLGRLTEDMGAVECLSIVVLDIDHGPGFSEIWHRVCSQDFYRLISVGARPADVSAFAGRAICLPVEGLEALNRLEQAVRELKMASFICKDADGNGAEVLAPADSQMGHVLRRCFAALSMGVPKLEQGVALRCIAMHLQLQGKPEEVKLKGTVPRKLLFRPKDSEPPLVRIDVEGVSFHGRNSLLESRTQAVRKLLEELIFLFDTPMYQRRLAMVGDKVAVRDLIREVHLNVLPSHGFPLDNEELDEVGRTRVVVQMQAFLHSGMITKEIDDLGGLLQQVSGYHRMRGLPMPVIAPPPERPPPLAVPPPLPASAAEGNPLDTNEYFVPPMTPAQVELLTVPFKDIKKRLRTVLEDYGTAIVTGVVDSTELTSLEEEFGRDLHDLVDRHAVSVAPMAIQDALRAYAEKGPRAFPARTAEKWLTASAGFGLHRCLCHGRFAWRVRRHPRVQKVFEAIFPKAGGRLVSSMDVAFFSPDGQDAAENNAFSAHVDQNAHDVRPGLATCDVYQGVLYVWPSGEDGHCSTTVVWPGSHKEIWQSMMQDKAFKLSGARGYHYSEVRAMLDKDRARGLAQQWARSARRAVVPAGGMLLWSSRTVHAGWKGGPRLAQAVCFEPAARRPEAERMSKLRLAALGLASSHWAAVGMQHDMCIGSPGCLENRSTIADDDGSGDPSRILLPLRKALHPTGLIAEADWAALWDLVAVDYRHTGMWAPKKDYCDLLESSVLAEIKRYL